MPNHTDHELSLRSMARTICDDMTLKIADIFDNQLIKTLIENALNENDRMNLAKTEGICGFPTG